MEHLITSTTRIGEFWAAVLLMKSKRGELKFQTLSKVVKSVLAIQNGNADVERSLSDNKNTLTYERTKLSDDTLIGLRRMKDHARSCEGAQNVDTNDKEIVKSVQEANSKYKERKRQEEEERRIKLKEKNEREEQDQRRKN